MPCLPFNQIKIYIKSKKSKRIPFYLTLNESSFTTPNEVFSNLPLFCIINYTKEGWYVLDKNDFEITEDMSINSAFFISDQGLNVPATQVYCIENGNFIFTLQCSGHSSDEINSNILKKNPFIHSVVFFKKDLIIFSKPPPLPIMSSGF